MSKIHRVPTRILLSSMRFEEATFAEHIENLIPESTHLSQAHEKCHTQYLSMYLRKAGAETIVVEIPYFDRNMLKDHWTLYADATSGIEYNCARLHFFKKCTESLGNNSNCLSIKKLGNFINKSGRENYLGFVVIVLRSEKMIGTTCLAPPNLDASQGNVTMGTTVKYPVNLVGFDLSVESLGFREQDTVTSACATCALWSTLQKTREKFSHGELSPGEITARALNLHNRGDAFPSIMGLTNDGMSRAINSIPEIRPIAINFKEASPIEGIEQERKQRESNAIDIGRLSYRISIMVEFILPFIDHGVPVLLIMTRYDNNDRNLPVVHAVSVVGYVEYTNISGTHAERVREIIVHDDNIGPFVRYRLKDRNLFLSEDYGMSGPKWEPTSAIGISHSSVKVYSPMLGYSFALSYNQLLRGFVTEIENNLSASETSRGIYNMCINNADDAYVMRNRIYTSKDYKNKITKIHEGISHDKLNDMLELLLSSSLPEYILVLSVEGPIAHDILFSVAGPWQPEFLQIVPHTEKTMEFFAVAKKIALPAAIKSKKSSPEMKKRHMWEVVHHIDECEWTWR